MHEEDGDRRRSNYKLAVLNTQYLCSYSEKTHSYHHLLRQMTEKKMSYFPLLITQQFYNVQLSPKTVSQSRFQ